MKFSIAVLALLLSACASASSTEMRDIDRFANQILRTLPEIPSIGLSIVHDGKTYARGYGWADVARRIPSDADTGYYHGSNTKAYTAAVVCMLAQEGKLDLDAPVSKYIPELQFPAPIEPSQTTLRRFLSHTSGIENGPVVFRTAFSGEHTPAELIRILNLSKQGKPGFRYDNLGYVVASLVIERVTGQKWQDVLRQKLFEPLRMTRTTAYMSEARRSKMALPYDMNRAGEMAYLEFGFKTDATMHAAGGIVTTPNDVAKFLKAQLNPTPALAETQKQQTPAKRNSFVLGTSTGYGFGWYQSDLHGEKLIYHGGGYEGWRSIYSFLPEKKIAVGAMLNAGISHSPAELISAYAYDRLLHVPDVEAKYAAKLAELRARLDKVRANTLAEVAERSKRAPSLSKPLREYAGRYDSPTMGTLTISERDGRLVASIGHLSGVLEPFTEPESARVELVPGTGEVLKFTAEGLVWNGETLRRRGVL